MALNAGNATTVKKSTSLTGRSARFIVGARWLWLALTVALVALSIARIDQIWPLDPNARVFFAPENPDRQALDQFEETFAKDDNLMIVVVPKGGEVFTRKCLASLGILRTRHGASRSCAGSIPLPTSSTHIPKPTT